MLVLNIQSKTSISINRGSCRKLLYNFIQISFLLTIGQLLLQSESCLLECPILCMSVINANVKDCTYHHKWLVSNNNIELYCTEVANSQESLSVIYFQ